ncbi:MAG: response regulator, partial [Bacteriovoracia bacterium]
MDKRAQKKRELFKSFLLNNQVLIVDRIASSRTRLARTLSHMGAPLHKIHMTSNFKQAQTLFSQHRPKLVLCDYRIWGGSAFDLFRSFRENEKFSKDCIFIMVTANVTQAIVAKAAEEDVDAYILKPYNQQVFEKTLINGVMTRLYPSRYMLLIEKGKELLVQQNFEDALDVFDEAKKHSKEPSLACFYYGQTEYFLNKLNKAREDYEQGLEYNKIHYKCLVGLFDLFMKQERFDDAYRVVRKVAEYFPANPDRLGQVVHLAIRTGNFEDIPFYYDLYTDLDERGESIIQYISAGLYVSGKYFLLNKQTEKALQLYEKLAICCEGRSLFIRSMIEVLVDHKH